MSVVMPVANLCRLSSFTALGIHKWMMVSLLLLLALALPLPNVAPAPGSSSYTVAGGGTAGGILPSGAVAVDQGNGKPFFVTPNGASATASEGAAGSLSLDAVAGPATAETGAGAQDLMQFTSAGHGHALGFGPRGVILAAASHMLRVEFLNSSGVSPLAESDFPGASGLAGPAAGWDA